MIFEKQWQLEKMEITILGFYIQMIRSQKAVAMPITDPSMFNI